MKDKCLSIEMSSLVTHYKKEKKTLHSVIWMNCETATFETATFDESDKNEIYESEWFWLIEPT